MKFSIGWVECPNRVMTLPFSSDSAMRNPFGPLENGQWPDVPPTTPQLGRRQLTLSTAPVSRPASHSPIGMDGREVGGLG